MCDADCRLIECCPKACFALDDLFSALIDLFFHVELQVSQVYMGTYPGNDLKFIEWLGDEIHTSGFETRHPIPGITQSADEDDGDVPRSTVLFQVPADLKAIHLRHPHV